MRDLSDMIRYLKKPQYLVSAVIGIVVVIFLVAQILGGKPNQETGGGPDGGDGPPREGGENGPPPDNGAPPVPPIPKNGMAILYDMSKSIPEVLGHNFDSAIEEVNEAVNSLIFSNQIDSNVWEIAEGASYPRGDFDVIVFVKMGEPKSKFPFFEVKAVEQKNLKERLPSSWRDFQSDYTYITLAKAVGTKALEEKKVEEMYLLIVSDFQESKRTRPPNSDWADFSREFDGIFKIEIKLISAGWKQLTDFQIKLIKIKRE